MIPNLDQLLIVCGIVTVVVFAIVYVLISILKSGQSADSEQEPNRE
ncbi:hypothetical protein QTP81_16510 [Alteromonas sp. ASW11-36]|uniref:DUF3149 domain-containing protein n=1 Tax=Alteromonas arenosi TaxID=3055817 RepID=A0ABT7T178_9ALTE|nr:hypothetical protein [Alteromonas sp. ASW11-36]MDM7862210.1 hypothetical protein [Alteromonas sp. ASW11-36]